jgi:PAS domain S-box-containing protein
MTMTLTRRLLLLALISILPAIAIWTYTEVSLRRAREAEVRDLALRQAELAASELDRIFDGVQTVLATLAVSTEIRDPEPGRCAAYLGEVKDQLSQVAAIALLDLDGRVVCRQESAPPGLSFADRSYFREAVATDSFTVGEYTVAAILKKPVLPVALPVHAPSGALTGVLAAALDLRWLGQTIGLRALPAGGSLTIADRTGRIIAREPFPDQFVGEVIPKPFLHLVTAQEKGTVEALSQDGTKRILGYVPASLSPNRIYVSTGISSKIAFSAINAAAKRGFLLITAAFLLAISISGLAGRAFVAKPVQRMIAAIRGWQQGNYDARIALSPRSGELGIVAAAFNDLMDDVARRQAALQESEARGRLALAAGKMGTWWFDPLSRESNWSREAAELLGLPPGHVSSNAMELRDLIHPEDLAAAKEAFDKAVRGGEYEAEFRIRHPDGTYRWLNGRGRMFFGPDGRPGNMLGILQDITGRKQAEEQLRLLLDELNHRVKNTLATVQSIATQTLRTSDPAQFRDNFESRLLALSKTHDLLTRNAWREADLRTLIEQELAPYGREREDRIALAGSDVSLPARAVINLGLVVHELVTNAAKYGALSVPQGKLEVTWSLAQSSEPGIDLTIHWRESGGPPVRPPGRHGFGSRLIHRSVEGELSGRVLMEFRPSGLVGQLTIPVSGRAAGADGSDHGRAAAE